MTLRLDWLDPTAPGWAAELDALWRDLGAPHNAQLLPSHFVQTAFVKLGGQVLPVRSAGALRGVALLFPAGLSAGRPTYTLRLNEVPGAASLNLPSDDPAHHQVIAGARALLRAHHAVPETTALPQLSPDIRFYHPRLARSYPPTHRQVGIFSVGSPGTDELDAIRAMHMQIWGSAPGAQYPDDLHSAEFGPATSLVARAAGRLVGFLLGFYRFGGLDGLRQTGLNAAISIESQVMGVDSGLRRAGLAAALKRIQASEALARGIDVIHWTADPLQFANATLNFHKLRAVAGEFYPAYYPFQNALNRVPASRLGIVWLPGTAWGQVGLSDGPRPDRSLARFPGCVLLNAGPRWLATPQGAPSVALEIPTDWTALQASDLARARAWRATTDAILADLLGYTPGRYLIADVACEGERRYLVGHLAEQLLEEGLQKDAAQRA